MYVCFSMHDIITLNTKTYVSNEAINASYDFSPLEIDVMVAIINKIQPNRPQSERIELNMRELVEQYESRSCYDNLRAALKSLASKPFEIFIPEENRLHIAPFVTSIDIYRNTGKIVVTMSDIMRKVIMDIRANYTGFHIESILNMKGKYAKRFYLLACQFVKTNVRIINVTDLRKQFKIGDKYPLFADLDRKVIQPAIDEVNSKSDLNLSIDFKKDGRKVDQLVMTIVTNHNLQYVNNGDLLERLVKHGLSKWQAENVLMTLEREQISYILYKLQTSKLPIVNKGAWLAKSFRNEGVPMDRAMPKQITIDESISEAEAIAELHRQLNKRSAS